MTARVDTFSSFFFYEKSCIDYSDSKLLIYTWANFCVVTDVTNFLRIHSRWPTVCPPRVRRPEPRPIPIPSSACICIYAYTFIHTPRMHGSVCNDTNATVSRFPCRTWPFSLIHLDVIARFMETPLLEPGCGGRGKKQHEERKREREGEREERP